MVFPYIHHIQSHTPCFFSGVSRQIQHNGTSNVPFRAVEALQMWHVATVLNLVGLGHGIPRSWDIAIPVMTIGWVGVYPPTNHQPPTRV